MPSAQREASDYSVIEAIANKDATTKDIEEILRKRGINSVSDVVDHLRRDILAHENREKSTKTIIDFKRFSVPDDYKPIPRKSHRAPTIPILVDRVLVDPSDIDRFDGQELHLVVAPDRKSMIGITDRRLINEWWKMTYISAMLGQGTPEIPSEPGKAYSYRAPDSFCAYYEDNNYGGSSISHGRNRGYADLTEEHSGIFGWGTNWNDRISSFMVVNMGICVLHEHVFWAGGTLTVQATPTASPEGPVSYPLSMFSELNSYGWNDVASSVEGW